MPADMLVVTPSSTLGEAIQKTLEETKLYRIHVVHNKSSAIVRADELGAPLALLDYSLGDDWVNEIGQALRTVRPGINLIILCDENITPPAFDKLRPWILVRKPFKMSAFMMAISAPQATAAPTPQQSTSSNTSMSWLSDVSKAAQHLTRLTLESSAQAALITRNNEVWSYAGGLSANAAKEVAQTVTRNWDGQKGSDLLRFIRLESTKAEHMLYATRLSADTVLALVFDAETPFSTIRSQASQLVGDLGNERSESPKPAKSASKSSVEFPADLDDGESMDNISSISNILSDIPTPNPSPSASREFKQTRKKERIDPNQTRVSVPMSNASVFNREASPTFQLENLTVANDQPQSSKQTAQHQTDLEEIEVTAPSQPRVRPETPVVRPKSSEEDVTRESPTTDAIRKLVVEPTSAGLYHLTYACLLVPRFTSHYITGDLADHVSKWLPNICIAFGWRLEYLAVRPEYLQWVVNVQPNTSPGYLMRIMRQQTSEKIFAEFNRFKKENPSGDFWAPGYLIMGGSQPHPAQLVRDYIQQTRQRQGQEDNSQGFGR
ncbi:MAG: transposase [Chloroflexi bacterium]|nr:transposase [Chloroflexota bacterium]